MKKTIAIALTAAALLGTAAPALAGPFGGGDAESRDFAAAGILDTLQKRGIDATGVEEWGDYVRAYVRLPDGSIKMAFFDPIGLQQVTP